MASGDYSLASAAGQNEGSGLRQVFGGRRMAVLLCLVIFCLFVDVAVLAVKAWADFRNYRDIGYPDSAILFCIANYVHTAHLYPDINRPPYLPTPYGPLGYVIMSVPYRLAEHFCYSPQRALRLAVFTCFLTSVALVFLVSRRLNGSTKVALLASLFAASGPVLREWTMQIRFDFLGLDFALVGIWLLLDRGEGWQPALAAVCGGLALLCKLTFVAMPAAVFLCLLWQRRFAPVFKWALGVFVTVIVGYGFFISREPLAWQHFAALYRPFHLSNFVHIVDAVRAAKVLFSFFGAYLAWRRRDERGQAIVLYFLASLLVGDLTALYLGGNTNYFEEFWAVSSVLAAPGLVELSRPLQRTPSVIFALVMVLVFYFLAPKVHLDLEYLSTIPHDAKGYAVRKAQWDRFHSILVGRRLLALSPDIALWSRLPEVPDPLLNSALESGGRWSSLPIVRNIETGTYEAIVEDESLIEGFSDVIRILPPVRAATRRCYRRACQLQNVTVWLPAHGSHDLLDQLEQAGCTAE